MIDQNDGMGIFLRQKQAALQLARTPYEYDLALNDLAHFQKQAAEAEQVLLHSLEMQTAESPYQRYKAASMIGAGVGAAAGGMLGHSMGDQDPLMTAGGVIGGGAAGMIAGKHFPAVGNILGGGAPAKAPGIMGHIDRAIAGGKKLLSHPVYGPAAGAAAAYGTSLLAPKIKDLASTIGSKIEPALNKATDWAKNQINGTPAKPATAANAAHGTWGAPATPAKAGIIDKVKNLAKKIPFKVVRASDGQYIQVPDIEEIQKQAAYAYIAEMQDYLVKDAGLGDVIGKASGRVNSELLGIGRNIRRNVTGEEWLAPGWKGLINPQNSMVKRLNQISKDNLVSQSGKLSPGATRAI